MGPLFHYYSQTRTNSVCLSRLSYHHPFCSGAFVLGGPNIHLHKINALESGQKRMIQDVLLAQTALYNRELQRTDINFTVFLNNRDRYILQSIQPRTTHNLFNFEVLCFVCDVNKSQ